jgi:4,5-dihydroxyphthalate decarboxylase
VGDVAAERIDLTLRRTFDALTHVTDDPLVHGGEASFGRFLQRLAGGDRSFVGLPAFVMFAFRHRCFFVRKGSGLTSLIHLTGKRIGTPDAWRATGNTWARSYLRQSGVRIGSISWLIGPVNPGEPPPPPEVLPPGVETAPTGRYLRDMLLAGDLDALLCPWPPTGFYDPGSSITRLFPDYRAVEREYYQRTKIYPALHVVVLKRQLVDRHPWVVKSIYTALKQARERSDANLWISPDSSPWLLADLEEQVALMGRDFQPYGFRENRHMVVTFCAELLAQDLIRQPLDPDAVFAEFEQLMR